MNMAVLTAPGAKPYSRATKLAHEMPPPASIDPPVVPVVFNDRAILNALGDGPEAIRRSLRLYKQTDLKLPTSMTVYQWTSRGRIAHAWRPRLLYCALKSGKLTMAQALMFEHVGAQT